MEKTRSPITTFENKNKQSQENHIVVGEQAQSFYEYVGISIILLRGAQDLMVHPQPCRGSSFNLEFCFSYQLQRGWKKWGKIESPRKSEV